MSKRELGWLVGGVVAGIVFAGPIRKIPLVGPLLGKLPTV